MEASRPASADDIPRVVELAELMRAELAAMRGGALWLEREAWPEPLADAYDALLARDDALLVGRHHRRRRRSASAPSWSSSCAPVRASAW